MAELRSCPFCGRPVTGEWEQMLNSFATGRLYISHDKLTPKIGRCALGDVVILWAGSADEAAAIWNRRNGSDERTEK